MIYAMVHKKPEESTTEKWKSIEQLFRSHGVDVIDGSALPRMAKIDVPKESADLIEGMKEEWDFFPEKKYKVPTTRRGIKK
jgi:hypothetical protein